MSFNRILSALSCTFILFSTSCSKEQGGGEPGDIREVIVTTVTESNLSVSLTTDKAVYRPGETVKFTTDAIPSGAMVRYRNGTKEISVQNLSAREWTWQTPSADYTGYLADIYTKDGDKETILGTIAVDVSSDWGRFPRYGFVSDYGENKTEEVIRSEMQTLNRLHINGVQFYDWHYKHHWPLGGTPDKLLTVYKDIFYKKVYLSSVQNYIKVQHEYGMKSMFYNLCYGALDNDGAEEDGVKRTWYVFQDTNHGTMDYHGLRPSGKSDIYVLDPSNTEWQEYIGAKNEDVYTALDFDGYHIDQLGNRGTRYTYDGKKIDMQQAYASFIKVMKSKRPDKRLVMNAVSNFGAENMSATGDVDFCYNEMWGSESNFTDLRSTILLNRNASPAKDAQTVFAAYMNYNLSGSSGYFNTAGVLLTDAVIFALGGAHLEMSGDHMLGSEYFPNCNLKMKPALNSAIVRYYDFMTAYENYLRGAGEENAVSITSSSKKFVSWTGTSGPQKGVVVTYSRKVGGVQMVNLLNFVNANSLSWRDADGTMSAPTELKELEIHVSGQTSPVKKVWLASPDLHGCAPVELSFRQKADELTLVIPSLKYWDMMIIEY